MVKPFLRWRPQIPNPNMVVKFNALSMRLGVLMNVIMHRVERKRRKKGEGIIVSCHWRVKSNKTSRIIHCFGGFQLLTEIFSVYKRYPIFDVYKSRDGFTIKCYSPKHSVQYAVEYIPFNWSGKK